MIRGQFVPEAVILYLLKHSLAFDWACINCQCRVLQTECPIVAGGKWQTSQGETGLDLVAKFSVSRGPIVDTLPSIPRYLVLESKGDRVKVVGEDHVMNRPAYNEMVGSLSAFLLSNWHRIKNERETHMFGWLCTNNLLAREIEAFTSALKNLPFMLPSGAGFVLGIFRSDKFWEVAPEEVQDLARMWFVGPEQLRNALLWDRMSRPSSRVNEILIGGLFDFA